MIRNTIIRVVASLVLALATGWALAEDIDIFSQNSSITPDAPNVLIVLDNSSNWSQSFAGGAKFDAEKIALATVVSALKTQFNLGIMMYTETGAPNTNIDAGYVRFAIQAMTDSSGNATAARNCLLQMVGAGTTCTGANTTYYSSLDVGNDKGNKGAISLTMSEVYDYYAGLNAYGGDNKVKADTRAFVSGTIAGPQYKSPVAANSCQKNFIIVINNGPFQDPAAGVALATTQLSSAGGDTTVINPPDNGTSNNNEADEWVRFLHKVSTVQAVTYTLEVGPKTDTQGIYNTALLQSMGRQGKGGYYSAIDASTLQAALNRIFNDIQAVNSVFASSSLPLSADNSGAFSDQIYMGVFRPDGQGQPRWVGNLKEYQFALDSNSNLQVVDANGLPAAGASGFATPDAVSFWTSKNTSNAPDAATVAATGCTATTCTTGSTNGFWYFDSKGSGGNFDSPDGEWVEKGGAAEQLRHAYLGYGSRGGIGDTNASTLNSLAARQVYTCTGTCLTGSGAALSGTPFDSTNISLTPTAFGISSMLTVSGISSTQSVTSLVAGGTSQAVSTLVATATTATVTTPANHGYGNGNLVTISGSSIAGTNGTFSITKTGNKTFTYPVSVTAGTATGAITATLAATAATVTITGTPHNLTAGTSVFIAGATCPATPPLLCPFNGTFTVAVAPAPTSTTFTYTLPGNGVGATASGTITVSAPLARATTSSTNSFSNGDSVTVAGANCVSPACAAYNGTFTISNVTTSTFDYSYTGSSPFLPAASNSGMTATDSTAASAALVPVIKWIRGQDTQDENGFKVNGTNNTDVRASIHGDVLHSRPVVLNYDVTGSTNNVYVFYGGNDGVFRAVKGGQAATDGNEQWAFIPQEFFGRFQRLYNNSPVVLYPSTPANLTPTPTGTCVTGCAAKRDYFWDGPVGSYIERNSLGVVTKAYLYLAVRRGGRFIYALDVTSPTAPKLLWTVSSTTTGFSELGQTWSAPQVAKIHHALGGSNTNNVALIFGGGYDAVSEDPEPPAAVDTMGRGIFVLDAFTGSLVWWASSASGATLSVPGMTFGIAADVTLVNRDLDGLIDRVYAADLGGNVWRVDMDDPTPSNWKVWLIAAVGSRSANASTRKFLFSPDIVLGAAGDTFDAVVIGSGDREHPLASNGADGVVNRVYMFADTAIGATGVNLGITDSCGATVSSGCSNLFDATSSPAVPATAVGWLISLATGEKVINGPIVIASDMIFGTNQPDPTNSSCSGNLGIAKRYDINFLTGAGALFTNAGGTLVSSEVAPGGGFLPSPIAGNVEIGGVTYTFVTDNPLNPGGVIPVVINVPTKRFRTFWREVLE
jgi:type IV pilus assembly protein PilY1